MPIKKIKARVTFIRVLERDIAFATSWNVIIKVYFEK
jgi:hypothetical protein